MVVKAYVLIFVVEGLSFIKRSTFLVNDHYLNPEAKQMIAGQLYCHPLNPADYHRLLCRSLHHPVTLPGIFEAHKNIK
jgi:hypothetical protein